MASAIAGKDARPPCAASRNSPPRWGRGGDAEVFCRPAPHFALLRRADQRRRPRTWWNRTMCITARCCTRPPWCSRPAWPPRRPRARPAPRCGWPASPATRPASASARLRAARTTGCSTPPARSARWPPPRRWAKLFGLDAEGINHALRLRRHAGRRLWEFLRDRRRPGQRHTAPSVAADGLQSARLRGTRLDRCPPGPRRAQGLGVGMSSDANPPR